jgi:hypothetical protein
MKVIQLGRGEGKTTALVEWLRAAPVTERRILVSCTEAESSRLRGLYADELDRDRFVSIAKFNTTTYADRYRLESVFAFDNAELALHLALNVAVGAIALTPEKGAASEQI